MRCFQALCRWHGWHHIRSYIRFHDPDAMKTLGMRPAAAWIPRERVERPVKCTLPESWQLIGEGKGKLAKMAWQYMEGRGFDIEPHSF